MCSSDEHQATIDKLTDIENLLKKQQQGEDDYFVAPISDTLSCVADFRGRRFLFALASVDLILNVPGQGTLLLPANTWRAIITRPGAKLTTSGQSSAVSLQFLATDHLQLPTLPVLANFASNNISVPTGAGNTIVKAGPGSLVSLVVTSAGTGAGNVLIYDNAATNAGTLLFAFPATIGVAQFYQIQGWAKNGITIQNVANGPIFTVFFS